MQKPSLSLLMQRFRDFTSDFLIGPKQDRYNIQLKIDHSLRVLDEARNISESEGFDENQAYQAHVAALFHDTGRFPQYRKYGNYEDAKSENHARLGLKTLIREKLINDVPMEHRRVTFGAVFLHNVRQLPENMTEALSLTVRTVRDSDKLDIFPIMIAHMNGTQPMNKVVTLGVKQDPDRYSEEILDSLLAGLVGRYTELAWSNDLKLLLSGWVFDLNFPTSARVLRERGNIQTILDSLPRNAKIDRYRDMVLTRLDTLCKN